MNCISNLERINYPSDLVYDLTQLYTYKGKDFHYEDVLKQYMTQIIKSTIEKDTIEATKVLNLNIPDNRLKLIVKKDSEPKTRHERIAKNLKSVFEIVQKKGTELELTDNEFLQLGTKIFKDVHRITYVSDTVLEMNNMFEEKKKVSRRDLMKKELTLYLNAKTHQKVEATQAITNLYVDLLNMKCFDIANDFISLMICYCCLFSERFNVFKYVSFFELYNKHIEEFKENESGASYGWESGFSKTASLNKLIIKVLLEGYTKVEGMVSGLEIDKKLRKVDNVEATIMKLGDVFSREDIKNKVPNLSDSTINRALTKLRDEGKIRPDGTGRSAKWIRLVPEETFSGGVMQMDIFSFIKQSED